jgi:hypothetical protein
MRSLKSNCDLELIMKKKLVVGIYNTFKQKGPSFDALLIALSA